MISPVSAAMIKCHEENGMHGPLTIPFDSYETNGMRAWVAENAPDEAIWWCDRSVCHVMTKSTGLLIQLKLLFGTPE
jgi:hypothetical protein